MIVRTGKGPRFELKVVVNALSAVIVKLHVLVAQAAADPEPPEKTPGVDGEGEFAERVRDVPEGMEKTQVAGLAVIGLQVSKSVIPVAPVFGPICVMVRLKEETGRAKTAAEKSNKYEMTCID